MDSISDLVVYVTKNNIARVREEKYVIHKFSLSTKTKAYKQCRINGTHKVWSGDDNSSRYIGMTDFIGTHSHTNRIYANTIDTHSFGWKTYICENIDSFYSTFSLSVDRQCAFWHRLISKYMRILSNRETIRRKHWDNTILLKTFHVCIYMLSLLL